MSESLFVMTVISLSIKEKRYLVHLIRVNYERSKIVLFYLFVNLLTLRTKLMLDNLDW